MKIWVDAQLPPSIAEWIALTFGVESLAVRDLGLRDAADSDIFKKAGADGIVVMTKDRDFVRLLEKHGPPPQILWVTCGNTSNTRLREVLGRSLSDALKLLQSGEPLVEISDQW